MPAGRSENMRWHCFPLCAGIFGLAACGVVESIWAAAGSSPVVHLKSQVAHHFDGAPLRLDDLSLKDRAGERLSVSRLAYLVSEVSLLRSDGSPVRLEGPVAYLNPA